MRVHRARVNEAVVFPHVPKQSVPGLHAAGALREGGEQLELGRRQFKRPVLPAGQMPRHVNQQVPEPHLVARFLPGLAPRKDFFDAEQKFARTERLGQVIVRAQFQAEHPVNLRGLGREHDDGNPGGGRIEPQRLANLKTVHLRQHHVEHDQIRRLSPDFFQCLRAVRRRAHGIAGLLEVELHQFNRFRLIIHHQYSRLHLGLHITCAIVTQFQLGDNPVTIG